MYERFCKEKKLSELSTFGIGGIARYFIEVKDVQTIQAVLQFCTNERLPFLVVGKGSNCLFSDTGFDGLVIANKIDFIEEEPDLQIYVGAGTSFSLLGTQTAKKGLSGLEFAAGIPASVGGAIYMNAGAQGQDTQTSLVEVEFVDEQGVLHRLNKSQMQFGYRSSPFQKMKGVIVAARFQLQSKPEARKEQLDLLQYRIHTQPYHEKSAGCVFRNPQGHSAGSLIDKAGLKGVKIGGASVSEMHANFLINKEGATSQDVKRLIALVQHTVKEKYGVELETEIRIWE